MKGYLVVENGHCYQGTWVGGEPRAGELVFNTAHAGYEEIATDPSYFGQIMIMCAPHQGNYGVNHDHWESRKIWFSGFACLELDSAPWAPQSWQQRLLDHKIPIFTEFDTRSVVLQLRDQGTSLGALVPAASEEEARNIAQPLFKNFKAQPADWAFAVSRRESEVLQGQVANGPRVAVVDFGCKTNILRELQKRCAEIKIFPARTSAAEILAGAPHGLLLSNGPGDPAQVQTAVGEIQKLIGKLPIFGICMGHQLLAKALGAETFKLKYGHRGVNHPVEDLRTGEIFVTSQNHGYGIAPHTIPANVRTTHMNLNDKTVAGIDCREQQCFSVQFHPESHPGPREAEVLFDQFVAWMKNANR